MLIEEDKIEFSVENVEHLEGEDLKVLFIALNFEVYLAGPDKYTIDDPFRQTLLSSELFDAQKLNVISDIDPAFVSANASLASAFAELVNKAKHSDGTCIPRCSGGRRSLQDQDCSD
ncbi:hypothetical protein [Neorhizobium tomejilense]|uniref:hypothetical protein n=1 Tax=Neorhizobium tomejilense TaxID=2093828 RepID=UPI000CF88D50|nr:hypothetical protein [Neorhizobium tomejilense]